MLGVRRWMAWRSPARLPGSCMQRKLTHVCMGTDVQLQQRPTTSNSRVQPAEVSDERTTAMLFFSMQTACVSATSAPQLIRVMKRSRIQLRWTCGLTDAGTCSPAQRQEGVLKSSTEEPRGSQLAAAECLGRRMGV